MAEVDPHVRAGDRESALSPTLPHRSRYLLSGRNELVQSRVRAVAFVDKQEGLEYHWLEESGEM